jgi:hypothetical protein
VRFAWWRKDETAEKSVSRRAAARAIRVLRRQESKRKKSFTRGADQMRHWSKD